MCKKERIANIIWHNRIDSTNLEAKRRITELGDMTVLAALEQTAGKGQGDHKWHSAPGDNLTFTIVLKHENFPAMMQMTISAITVVTLIELLRKNGIDAWFKWPNDIYIDKKKICGILIEHGMKSDHLFWSIIGIGLNVNQESFPSDLPNPVSMFQLDRKKRDITLVLKDLCDIYSLKLAKAQELSSQLQDIVLRAIASKDGTTSDENLRTGFRECIDILL